MSKLPIWKEDWAAAERAWDQKAEEAALKHPLKGLGKLPKMVGITSDAARGLKWKSLFWMIRKDHKREILKGFLRHPFKYGWEFIKSAIRSKPYQREGDFFFYGVNNLSHFEKLLGNEGSLLILGFSYCHKPFECPSGRFSADCQRDLDNRICQQCFIGKAVHAGEDPRIIPVFIPTIHYIGGKVFEIVHQNPSKSIYFIITACEMTLEMFGDWGNMVNIRGIGIRLDGRICNTMKAFELSEEGIKPGLTLVLPETQKKVLSLIGKFIYPKI